MPEENAQVYRMAKHKAAQPADFAWRLPFNRANARNVVAPARFNLTGDAFVAHQSAFTKFLANFSLMERPSVRSGWRRFDNDS